MKHAVEPEDEFISWVIYLEREFGLTKEQVLRMPALEYIKKIEQLITWKKAERQPEAHRRMFR